MSEFGQPSFYRYYEHQELPATLGFHTNVVLLVFGPAGDDLVDPNVEPVGIYHYAGTRRYLWRDLCWNEADWNRRIVQDNIAKLIKNCNDQELVSYQKTLALIRLAYRSGAPSPTDDHPPLNDPLSIAMKNIFNISLNDAVVAKNKQKRYCRVIYENLCSN